MNSSSCTTIQPHRLTLKYSVASDTMFPTISDFFFKVSKYLRIQTMSLQIAQADGHSIQSFLLLPKETSRTWFYCTIVEAKCSHKPRDRFFWYSWPSLGMGSVFLDSTNRKSKIFRGKKRIPESSKKHNLNLLPADNNLHGFYMVLGITTNYR